MENLFAKNFPGLFTIVTNGDYMRAEIVGSSFTAHGRTKWIMQLNIFAVLRSYTFFKSHICFGVRVISFQRAEANHDKQQSNEASIYIEQAKWPKILSLHENLKINRFCAKPSPKTFSYLVRVIVIRFVLLQCSK